MLSPWPPWSGGALPPPLACALPRGGAAHGGQQVAPQHGHRQGPPLRQLSLPR
jgi:hypothetical protein